MLDTNGYSEIILHPPPINVFTLFILPCVIKKGLMKRAAEVYSKFAYWTENVFYIFGFLMFEIAMWPIVFIKVLGNVTR